MTTVDQQKIRRSRTGLIAHDPALAQPGYTLFAPMYGDGTVYLIDMAGEVAHSWRMPHRPGLYAHLLDNGHLFYGGKLMDDLDRFDAWRRFKGGAALEVDWQGGILWEVRRPDHHHDARKLKNGNVLLLCLRPLPAQIARRVQGGLPGTEAGAGIYADYLVEMTTAGEAVWEWRSWEHLEPEAYPVTPQDHRAEWTHGNTVAETADGNIIASFRNISTVVLIERATGNIIWQLGGPPLAQQHDPRPLANGNILIFDNGTHRRDNPATFSRVIEVDPRTSAIVWEYIDQSLFNFFSPYISGAQRLPNGNTLICEGVYGRLFEVTAGGEVVWEPTPYFFDEPGRPGLNNSVFRAFRYTPDEIAAARRAPKEALMSDIPSWHILGDWFDNCSCAVACPCTFAQVPDNGFCESVLFWHIRQGHYGDVSLDDLSFVRVGRWEGDLWAGKAKGVAGLYVDERADESQAEVLPLIFGGRVGGFPAQVAEYFAEGRQVRGVERARIAFEIAPDLGHWGVEIAGKVKAWAKALTGPTSNPGKYPQLMNAPGSETGPGPQLVTWGKSTLLSVDAFGFKFEMTANSAKHIPFDWAGP